MTCEFEEQDTENFYNFYMNIRKYYNLFRKNGKSDNISKIEAFDYVLNDAIDCMFFEEQMGYRDLKYKDLYFQY